MLLKKVPALFLCTFFVFGDAAFVDTLTKCSIKDGECHRNLLQTILRDIGKTGIPDLGIPPTDPYAVKNISVSVLNLIDIGMVEGVFKGLKDCTIDKFDTRIDNGTATMELTCDFTIKGKYRVFASSPVIKDLLGGNTVRGNGIGKVKAEKVHVVFNYHFLVRRINGELFIECQFKDMRYRYDFAKLTFAADNLYVGEQEASNLVIPLLNSNIRFIANTFGKPFTDRIMEIMYSEVLKFFSAVPTKHFITEDLSPWVTN